MIPIAVSVEVGAEMIDVSPTTFRSYIDQKLIPVVELPSAKHHGEKSRRVLILVDDLRAFVEKHRVTEPGR
jgi:Helix-turn-helix domain